MFHLIFVGRKAAAQSDNPFAKIKHKNNRISLLLVRYISSFNSEKLLNRL